MKYEIRVFTRDNCEASDATKIYLLKHGMSFAEFNTSVADRLITEMLIDAGYDALPIVEWDFGEESGSWVGFEPEKIQELAFLIAAN